MPLGMGIAAPPWDRRGRDIGGAGDGIGVTQCRWQDLPSLPGSPRWCPAPGAALRDPALRARLVLPRREGSNRE